MGLRNTKLMSVVPQQKLDIWCKVHRALVTGPMSFLPDHKYKLNLHA